MNTPAAANTGTGSRQLVATLLVAAAARALCLAAYVGTPLYDFFRNDHLYYREWGLRIAQGRWIGGETFEQGPLYAYFLGVLYRVVGPRQMPLLCVQSLGGLATVGLIWWCARRLRGGGAALAAGILAALYGPLIFSELLTMKTFLEPLLVMVALTVGLRGLESGRARWYAAAGAAVGLACLVREVHAILLAPLLLAAWCNGASAHQTTPRRLRMAGAVLLGCLLTLVPSFAHNWAVAREPVVVSSAGGQNLYISLGPYATGYFALPPFATSVAHQEHEDFREEAFLRTGRHMSRGESSRYWLRETLQWVRGAPWRTVRLVGRKAAILFNDVELPDSEDFTVTRGFIPALGFLPSFGWIAGPGFLGFLLLCRRRGAPRMAAGFAAVLILEVLLTFNLGRYRAAFAAVWLLCAGVGIAWLCSREAWRAGAGWRLRLTGAVAAALLTAAAFFPPPGRDPAELAAVHDRFRRQAEDAVPLRRRLPELEAALAKSPHDPDLLYEKAVSLDGIGRLTEAVQAYEATLAAGPDSAAARSRLITIYARTGEEARALEHARILVSLRPGVAGSWVALGRLLVKRAEGDLQGAAARGELGKAAAVLSSALARDSQDFQAHYWLARADLLMGKEADALRELEAALRQSVSQVRPREYLMAGQLARLVREMIAGRSPAAEHRVPL